MARNVTSDLSRRERQIMEAVYQMEESSVADVVEKMPDDPDYHTIRVSMANLRDKGYLKYKREGKRYIYSPIIPEDKAQKSALRHMVETFFKDSPSKAVLKLLDISSAELSDEDINQIQKWIDDAKSKNK
jgi:BlaI family transcriptional regulator, penicillinase repressor